MAFDAKQIFPNDTKPRVAIGVNLPFSEGGVFTPNYQTKDAIRNNLINYFLTNPGERPANPNFGAGLRQYVFTQLSNDNFEFIKEDIQDKINTFFPNVRVNSVDISSNEDSNTLYVGITYDVVNTGISDELELSFS